MIKRIALFHPAEQLHEFFNTAPAPESMFLPSYNIAIGRHVPALLWEGEKRVYSHVRWGKSDPSAAQLDLGEYRFSAQAADAKSYAVIPISGFYVWKSGREKEHPFFVRMMDNAPMAVAAFLKHENKNTPYIEFAYQQANTLIRPMSDLMPVLLTAEQVGTWIEADKSTAEAVYKQAGGNFNITDLTVHRVSKKVNDPANDAEPLIQPIPK
ncbi:MAG: SOS response-associated peptidase family protein [Balneolaceae bacterium]